MIVLYRLAKFVLLTVPLFSLILSPLIPIFGYLPSPYDRWCIVFFASAACFCFVSMLLEAYVFSPLDRRFRHLL